MEQPVQRDQCSHSCYEHRQQNTGRQRAAGMGLQEHTPEQVGAAHQADPLDSPGKQSCPQKHHEQLQNIGAIENFDSGDVTVERGDDKTSVVVTDNVEVVGAMEKLYMTVVVA